MNPENQVVRDPHPFDDVVGGFSATILEIFTPLATIVWVLWKVVQSTLGFAVVSSIMLMRVSSTHLLRPSKIGSWLEVGRVGYSDLNSVPRQRNFSEKGTNLECDYSTIEPGSQLFKHIFVMCISHK